MTVAFAKSENVLEIPLGDILPSSVPNYRRTFDQGKLQELADSMRQMGVLEPIVVRARPREGLEPLALELVFGERRLRAAGLAELPTIKAIIRNYDDNEVREARLIENLEREDVDPLEEAAAFQELVKLGYKVTGIAERLGQSPSYVAQRLQLTALSERCRSALAEGKITIGVAVLLAALPSEKLQDQGLEHVEADYDNRFLTVADARREIEAMVMMKLADAPFKTDDPELVPAAGACTNCPKRTGGQALLFADASSPDLCTDKLCYRSKQDADWKSRQKDLKAAGVNVLGVKEGEKAIQNLIYGSSEYVRLDSTHWNGAKHVKVAQVVGKKPEQLTLARDTKTGMVVELVPKRVLETAAKKARPEKAERSTPDAKAKAEREAERLKAEVNRRAMTAIVEAADAATRQGKPSRTLLRLAIRGALDSVWTDVAKKVADRRGLPLTDEGQGTTKKGAKRKLEVLTPALRIERTLESLDEGGLFALLLELAVGRSVPGKWSEGSDCYVELCAELGVNPKGLEAVIKAERKAKADGKGKPVGKVVHQFTIGGNDNASLCGKAEPGEKTATDPKAVTCNDCRAKAKQGKAKGKSRAAASAAEPPAPPRPEHPAKSKPVHYIDPSGISQTGLACGAEAADGKGVITEDASKVTCKNCRRTARLDDESDEPTGDED